MILSSKNDVVRVLDTEDFVVDTFSSEDFKGIQRSVGRNNFFDATRYVKKRVGTLLMLWVVDVAEDAYEIKYYIGRENVGLIVCDSIVIDRIYSLGVHSGRVSLMYGNDFICYLPDEVHV